MFTSTNVWTVREQRFTDMGIAVFKKWMKESDASEKKSVAEIACTSVSVLHQVGYEKRSNGKPFTASVGLAGRIAAAITEVNSRPRHKPLPPVGRGDFAPECARCPYYNSCGGFEE